MKKSQIGVFLVDDHPIVEAGIRLGFNLTDDFHLIGTALSHDRALNIIGALAPDIVILDLVIEGELQLDYINLYRSLLPSHARIVAFSSLEAKIFSDKCQMAGADGFISKSTSPHELVKTLRTILQQPLRTDQPPQNVEQISDLWLEEVNLTAREKEVAGLLAHGCAIQTIANQLGISKKTAAIHRDNLRGKLNCSTSSELIALLARRRSSAYQ